MKRWNLWAGKIENMKNQTHLGIKKHEKPISAQVKKSLTPKNLDSWNMPPWKLTYPLKMHVWVDVFSFSQVGYLSFLEGTTYDQIRCPSLWGYQQLWSSENKSAAEIQAIIPWSLIMGILRDPSMPPPQEIAGLMIRDYKPPRPAIRAGYFLGGEWYLRLIRHQSLDWQD